MEAVNKRLQLISTSALQSEADVELNVLTPLLLGANYLECPQQSIKAKDYLAPTILDKAAGKTGGYYPDYSVWDRGLPVMVVEAKSPEVDCAVGYREAALYARHLNQDYKSGLNPCHIVLASNGSRILTGTWDSKPEFDIQVSELTIGSQLLLSLKRFCAFTVLAEHARICLATVRPNRHWLPYNRAGGRALITDPSKSKRS